MKKWRKESKAWTDLNLVNCQREGLPHQIPGENRGPSYLLALQPAANHLHLIVRHKLYEDQLGIWPQSLLRRRIGVPASRESMGGCSKHVTCALEDMDSTALSSLQRSLAGPVLLNTWEKNWCIREKSVQGQGN